LSTFFQVDLEIIKIVRSEDFSLGFVKNISEFVILKRDIEKVRGLCCATLCNPVICLYHYQKIKSKILRNEN